MLHKHQLNRFPIRWCLRQLGALRSLSLKNFTENVVVYVNNREVLPSRVRALAAGISGSDPGTEVYFYFSKHLTAKTYSKLPNRDRFCNHLPDIEPFRTDGQVDNQTGRYGVWLVLLQSMQTP